MFDDDVSKTLDPSLFNGLFDLEELQLRGRHIETLDPSAFKDLEKLKTLRLNCPALATLDLNREPYKSLGSLHTLFHNKNTKLAKSSRLDYTHLFLKTKECTYSR